MVPIAKWGGYLLNHDGTCDYGEIIDPGDIEAFEVFGNEDIIRNQQGKDRRTFKRFRDKIKGRRESDFRKRKRILGNREGADKIRMGGKPA